MRQSTNSARGLLDAAEAEERTRRDSAKLPSMSAIRARLVLMRRSVDDGCADVLTWSEFRSLYANNVAAIMDLENAVMVASQ